MIVFSIDVFLLYADIAFIINSLQVKEKLPIPLYTISSLDDAEVLKGDFYSNEITKIANQDFHKIAAVSKQKDNKSFVKWQGYPDRFNSWVKNSDIQKLN